MSAYPTVRLAQYNYNSVTFLAINFHCEIVLGTREREPM